MVGMKQAVEMDRQEFEDAVFQPPRTVRMLEELGRWVGRLDRSDREYFTKFAQERFYELRMFILKPDDIRRIWGQALRDAAGSRGLWRVWLANIYEDRQVPGSQLRRED